MIHYRDYRMYHESDLQDTQSQYYFVSRLQKLKEPHSHSEVYCHHFDEYHLHENAECKHEKSFYDNRMLDDFRWLQSIFPFVDHFCLEL